MSLTSSLRQSRMRCWQPRVSTTNRMRIFIRSSTPKLVRLNYSPCVRSSMKCRIPKPKSHWRKRRNSMAPTPKSTCGLNFPRQLMCLGGSQHRRPSRSSFRRSAKRNEKISTRSTATELGRSSTVLSNDSRAVTSSLKWVGSKRFYPGKSSLGSRTTPQEIVSGL